MDPLSRIHKPYILKKGEDASILGTLPQTNIAHENPIFPSKYHQNGLVKL